MNKFLTDFKIVTSYCQTYEQAHNKSRSKVVYKNRWYY